MASSKKFPELDSFRTITDKFESLYTLVIHDITVQEVIDILFKKLETLHVIKDGFKRKYINGRIYSIIEYFKNEKSDDIVNCICLAGKRIEIIALSKQNIDTLKEYDADKFIFRYGTNFDIDYLNNLFFDDNFRNIIRIGGGKMNHIILNSTKEKVLKSLDYKEHDISEYINSLNSVCVIHCDTHSNNLSVIKNLKLDKKHNHSINQTHLTNDKILKIFDDYDMLEKHKLLEECMGFISNEKMSNRILFGKDIDQGVQNYMIKTIFCTPPMYKKLCGLYNNDLLNFEIHVVRILEKGDICDQLKQNYHGMIAMTYY